MHKYFKQPYTIALSGAFILAIVMGIGRFAYTPLFPLMQAELAFTSAEAGYLASINYLGYLFGALGGALLAWGDKKLFALRLSLVINIITTLVMGFTDNYLFWMILRFFSGLTSGLVFVLVSSVVLDFIASKNFPIGPGIFYSGVGFGIFFSGASVPIIDILWGWREGWIALGLFSLILGHYSFATIASTKASSVSNGHTTKEVEAIPQEISFSWLLLTYGCQGLGYIISATFLVAIINEKVMAFSGFSSLAWALVGLAAIPSCLLWSILAKKLGNIKTLIIAHGVQIIGVILPMALGNVLSALFGALLFGATFMGITTLSISTARNMFPEKSNKIIGYFTFIYALGQIIGPLVAGYLTIRTGSYDSTLVFAALILLLGAISLIVGKVIQEKEVTRKCPM